MNPPKSVVPKKNPVEPVHNGEGGPMTPEEPKVTSVVMTPIDAYLSERIKGQPSLDVARTAVRPLDAGDIHVLSLPEYFEKFSADCTRGNACTTHKKDKQGRVINPGPFAFRWILKVKRAIDYALNVRGWLIVNRAEPKFHEAPRIHFTANGAVEQGDAILVFMPVEIARQYRDLPGKRSIEKLRSQITPSKKKRLGVVMTGSPDQPQYYEPDLGATPSEAQEEALRGTSAE